MPWSRRNDCHEQEQVFYGVNADPVRLFAAAMFLMNRAIPQENLLEDICLIVVLLVMEVFGVALNVCVYALRKELNK